MMVVDDFLISLRTELARRPILDGNPFPTCVGVGWEGRPPALNQSPGYTIGYRHRPADTSYQALRLERIDLILNYLVPLEANLGESADLDAQRTLEACRDRTRFVLLDKHRGPWQRLGILRARPSTGVISRLPAPDENIVALRDEYEILLS